MEIRNYIARYIGFIITLSGLSGFLLRFYIQVQEETIFDILQKTMLISGSLVLITLFFEVLWYKFKSHNRFVGYIQLLTQETGHYLISSYSKKEVKKKIYLDKHKDFTGKKGYNPPKNIFAWEFVMSRLNGSNDGNSGVENIVNATGKIKFIFQVPSHYKFSQLSDPYSLDGIFFKEAIYPLYGRDRSIWKALLRFCFYTFCSFLIIPYLYLPERYSKVFFKGKGVDSRYVKNGWRFPRKIMQITFIPIAGLFTYEAYFIFIKHWEIIIHNSENYWKLIVCFGISAFVFLIWIHRYVGNIHELQSGKYSVDYYHWTFFIYRTQLLNTSYGIIPKVFSRGFIRFFKSRVILDEIDKLKSKNYKNTELKKYFENLTETDQENYIRCLKNCKEFGAKLRKIHDNINVRMKGL